MSEKFWIKLPHPEAPKPFLLSLGSLYMPYKVRVWTMRAEIKECTIIARSVDDMTEEEQEKYEFLSDAVFCATNWQEIQRTQTIESFLYLISIGVLPPNVSTQDVEFIAIQKAEARNE